MVNRIIRNSKRVLQRSLAMALSATMACTFLPEAASAEEIEEDSAIEMKFRDAPEDATDTDSDEVKAEKEYQTKNSKGQCYTCDTAEGKVVLDGDKLGESGKDLNLKLYISKEYVIEDSIQIYGSRKDGTQYTINFTSDDEYYIAELNQSDIDTSSDFIMTYSFKVKEGMIPSDRTVPVHAVYEYNGKKEMSSDISFSPIYESHTVKERVGSDNNENVDDVTNQDGTYIVSKDETIPFAVTIDEGSDTSKLRSTKEVTVKQKLPSYVNSEGKTVTAGFDEKVNEGWLLTSDKKYVEKTYKANSYKELINTISNDSVNLSFEGLALTLNEDFETYSANLKAEVSIEGVPAGQSEAEANFKANDEAMFTVTFKGSGTSKTEDEVQQEENTDNEKAEKNQKEEDTNSKKEEESESSDDLDQVSKLEKAQEKVENLKESNSKTLLVKYLFVAKNKLNSTDTIDTVMEGTDRSKIFTSFTVDTQLYKDSDGKYKAVANIPYLNNTAEGDVLDYQFANGNNDGEPVTQGVSFNKKTMVVTMDESALQADSDDFANLQLEIMIPVTQSSKSTMNIHVDNNSNIELAQGTDFSQTSAMFSVPRIQVATKETATKIKASDISVQVNGSAVDSNMINYDSSTGEVVLTGYPAMIDDVNITINKKESKTASQADRATGGSAPADTVAYLAKGTNGDAFQVGASVDTTIVVGHTAFMTTRPYQSPVGDNYVGAVNGSQMMTGSSIGLPTSLFGVNFQWYDSNGNSRGTYTGESGFNIGIPSYCQHIYDSAHFQRYLPATVRVLSKETSGGVTYVTFAIQTNVAFSGTGTAGVGQTLGCTFRVAFLSEGKVKVKKVKNGGNDSSVYNLSGAKYGVYSNSDCSGTPLAVLTTDSNGNTGEASLQNAGTYYVKEISAPDSFKLDTTIYKVKVVLGQTATITSTDDAKPTIKIEKKSDTLSLTNELSIYQDLSGFEYTIYSDEDCTQEVGVVTGTKNYLALEEAGTYYVKETKAPKNYELDSSVHKLEVTNNNDVNSFTFSDTPIYSNVEILINKTDERTGEGLEGAEFEVYYYDAVYSDGYNPLQAGISATRYWRLKSDSDGHVKLDKEHKVAGEDFYLDNDGKSVLPLGTVVIREVEAPTNYEIKEGSKIVSIKDSSKTKAVTIEDTPKIKLITVQKTSGVSENSTGNSAYSLEGAEYELYSDKDCTKLIDKFTTDEDGNIFKDYELFVGTYYLKETKAPKGYALNSEVFEFKVSKDQTFKVEDNPKFNPIDLLLTKKDEDSGEVLQGAYFEVCYYKGQYASTDEISDDVTPDAQWVFETDENGQIKMDADHLVSGADFYKDSEGNIGVPIGTITIQETKAPSNYQLDETVHLYQIKDDTSVKTETLDNYKAKTYADEKIPGQLTLIKKSANTALTRKNSMYSLAGAKYLISKDKEGKEEVATLTTNEYGETEALTDLKEGTYYAREIEAPKGYKLSSEVKKVTLKSGDSATFEFEDEPYYGTLDIFLKKKDSITNKYLEGAEYQVILYGSEDTSGSRLAVWRFKTDENGQIKLDDDHIIKGQKYDEFFFTDNEGSSILPLGMVTIQEVKAPIGYYLDKTVYSVPITQDSSTSQIQFNVREVVDEPEPTGLWIQKKSKFSILTENNNSYSLEGTEFTIYKDERCTEEVAKMTTDSEGLAKASSTDAPNLTEGTYYVKETKAPKGFKLDSISKKVVLRWGETTEVEFEDLPELNDTSSNFTLVHKVDSDTREALENVQYTVKFYEGNYDEGVDPASEGMSPSKTWVLKTDSNGDAILDANHLASGDELYTDEDGSVYLPLGTVTVQETQTASDDYELDDTVYVFTLQPDSNGNVSKISTVTASNKHRTGKFFVTKNSNKPELTGFVEGFSVEGAVYGVYTDKACTKLIKKLTVDKFGNTPSYEVDVTKTYYVKEITPPDKYDLDETVYEVKTNPDEVEIVYSIDNVQEGKAKVKKVSTDSDFVKGNSNYSLAGAKFGIYRDKACVLLVDTLTTDEDGNTSTVDLEVGTYYAKEISAPSGYHTDETLHKFTVSKDETATVEISDTPLYGQLTLEKESADKATTEGTDYYSLKGAIYGVYSDKACKNKVDELTTDSKGKTETIKLQLGTYYVKEIKAPLGYLIDDTVYEVEASSDPNTEDAVLTTLHVSDEVRKMDISIIKESTDSSVTDGNDNYSLEGAVFGVYSESTCKNLVGQLTANQKVDGKWKTDTLSIKIGTYYVKEITAPKGYELNTTIYKVDVQGDGDYNANTTTFTSNYTDGSSIERVNEKDSIKSTLTIKDDYQKAKVKIQKTSANANVTANNSKYSLEGAVYGIYSDKEATKELDRLTTNVNGISNTVELPLGIYYIKEITAPKGFELDTEVHEVDATKNDSTIKVELSDVPDSGKVKIKKSSTNSKVTDNNESYSLAGAEFSVYSDEKCTKWVATLTTDENGDSESKAIPIGTYYVKETKAPEGFEINTDVKQITVEKGQSQTVEFKDVPKSGSALVKKTSSLDQITSQNLLVYSLAGAEYSIYTDKAHTNLVTTLTTNEDGSSDAVDLPIGTYYVIETKASKGFTIDTEEKTIEVKEGLTTTFESIETPQGGIGQLKKTSSNSELTSSSDLYSLAGATYGIYLSDECNDSDKVGEFVTDEQGNSDTVQLPVGVYFVKEIKAPKGFAVDSKVHTMTIEQDKTATLSVVDQPGTAKVRLNKKSANTDITNYNKMYDFSGAVYTVYSDEACTQKVTTLTTDENGNTETKEISMGTYYIKETTAPDSFTLDTEVHKVELNDTETTVYVEVSEIPNFTPIELLLQKVDKETGVANTMLEGAEFTFRFYGAKYDEVPTDSKNLIRTWTLKTDSKGQIKFDAEHFVSGDEFFKDADGNVGLPYGTIVVQETKSPDGYLGDTNEYVIHNYKTEKFSVPTIKEEPVKFILEKKHKGTAILIPNATFRHTNPDGTYEDLKTGADGKLTISNAQAGTHFLQEIEAPAGYKINPTVLKVVVSKTGDYYNYGERKSTVKFDSNGGSAVSTTINKNAGDELGSLPTTSLAHYVFLGWYTAKTGGTKIESTDLMPADDTTYYAHWTKESFNQQVQVRYQNADGTYGNYQTVYDRTQDYGSTVSWSQDATNEYEAVSIASYTVTEDKITRVDIPRKQVTLTVGIDSLIDSSGNSTGSVTYDTTDGFGVYTLKINGKTVGTDIASYTSPILVGSTYEISNIKSSTSKTSYVKVVSGSLTGTVSTNTRVGLQFSTSQTTVTYNAQGGTVSGKGSSWSFSGYYGQKLGTLETPTRDGYTFKGWYTEQNGGTKISSSTTYPLNDTTYYALWEANTYSVTYSLNGGSNGPSKQTFAYNSGATLSSIKPIKTGYTFTGWSLNSTILQPGAAIPTNSKDITLTAQWSLDTYTISYDIQDGAMSDSDLRTSYNVNSSAYTLPTPTRTGYTFIGWTGSNGTTAQTSVTIAKGSTGDKSYTANWKANTYTVSYNVNGGEIQSGSSSEVKTFGNTLGNFPSVSRKGYTLKGWYTATSGGSEVTTSSPVPSANTTYYAQWTPVTYTITYDNVDSTDELKTSYNIETATFTLGTPTRTGYTFTGWTGSNGTTAQTTVSIAKGSTGNLTYRANWTPTKYSISYNLNGGSLSGQTTQYTIESDTITLPIPTKTGYTFVGWTGSNGSTAQTSVTIPSKSTGDKSYTANWTANNYTITYKANGGTGSDQTQTATYGTAWTSKDAVFTRDGYTLTSWNTLANGKGTEYSLNTAQTDKQLADVTLYAQWTPITYSIAYNLDGGSISGQKTSYDIETSSFTLPTPTKEGYTFTGWTGSNGDTPQTSVTVAKGSLGNKTYTANWRLNSYKVKISGYLDGSLQDNTSGYGTFDVYIHDSSGAGVFAPLTSVSEFEMYLSYGSTIEVKNVSATTGHTYVGVKQIDSKYTTSLSGTVGVNGCYIGLEFNTNSYTLTYDGNGETSGSVSTQTVKYGDGYKVAANGFTRTNYEFTGWNTAKDGSGTDYTSYIGKTNTWNMTENVTLYAQWKIAGYTLTYNPNGGEVSPKTAVVEKGQQIGSMPTPTKTGYSFAGWYTSASGGTQLTSTSTIESNTTVYAHWTPITYTVTYDANGGSGTTEDSTHTYGIESKLNKNKFYRNGYSFAGWATSASGSVEYSDEDDVTNLAPTEGESVTLYAKWTPKTIVVTYNANGGSGTTSNKATFGEDYTVLSGSAVTRDGYTFKGWSTMSSGLDNYGWTDWSGAWAYDNGQNGVADDSLTLYAIWVKKSADFSNSTDVGWIDVWSNVGYTVRCYVRYFLDSDARQIKIRITTMQIQAYPPYAYYSDAATDFGYRLVYYNGSTWTDVFQNRGATNVTVGTSAGGPAAYTFPDANCDLVLNYLDDGTLPTAVKVSAKCLVEQKGVGAAYVPRCDWISYDSAIDITSRLPSISAINKSVNSRESLNLLARGNADVLEDGTYAICSMVDEDYCIGVTGASTSSEALVQPQKYTGESHQLWTVSHDSNGYIQFKNVNSGMWLNDKNGSTSNQSPIQQYKTDSTTDYANKWIVTRESNGYRIVTGWENTHSKLRAIDLYNNDTSESGLIDLYENNDSKAQRWIFKKVSD